jgi:hypothetical protein
MTYTYFKYEIKVNGETVRNNIKVSATIFAKEDALELLKGNFGRDIEIITLKRTTMKNYKNGQF